MKKKPQNPEARRLVITLFVLLVAAGIVLAVIYGGPQSQPEDQAEIETPPTETATAQGDVATSATSTNNIAADSTAQQATAPPTGTDVNGVIDATPATTTDATPVTTTDATPATTTDATPVTTTDATPATTTDATPATTTDATPATTTDATPATTTDATPATTTDATLVSLSGLKVASSADPNATIDSLGSLDPTKATMELQFTSTGAGITSIVFSDIWQTASAHRQADEHMKEVAEGQTPTVPLPENRRYVLQRSQTFTWNNNNSVESIEVPILGSSAVEINGQRVSVFSSKIHWAQISPGVFRLEIVNEKDEPVLEITRRFVLGDQFDITLHQDLKNLTQQELDVSWIQYGPTDLDRDRARYMDRRRIRYGYELALQHDPKRLGRVVGSEILEEYSTIVGDYKDHISETPNQDFSLWPKKEAIAEGYTLSWFASTNRYFALAVHPLLSPEGKGDRGLRPEVTAINAQVQTHVSSEGVPEEVVFTALLSETVKVAGGQTVELHFGVYAGPLDRYILSDEQPYAALNMNNMILYVMSSMCACCTFQWLAIFLLDFLTFLHNYVVFDWGIAIIVLVITVRALLHPLTKRSQISMQGFSKQMGTLKPELEKLKKKFPNDKKRQQQEQMRLMQEKGINPLSMLGCLPLFLQMPIWVALYAMLYFAFDLRQQPAFFGFFQLFWDWPFLADLATPDHFFGEFKEPIELWGWVNITGINVLPLLMAVMWYIQQKYLAPPPNPSMSKEMLRQQKFMQVMIIFIFPIMLYSAPSGLTMYILTSSSIGILEGRHIRKQIETMDFSKPRKKRQGGDGKGKDPGARAYQAAMQRVKDKRRGPSPRYKKRS